MSPSAATSRILLLALPLFASACAMSEKSAADSSKTTATSAPAAQEPPPPAAPAGALPPLVTTPSGLQYVDLRAGTGPSPVQGKRVVVHYTGRLKDGTKFDSSVDRGQPFVFVIGVGQVIKGWDEGVSTMKVGGFRKLIIPPQLGYGERGAGNVIPPNSELHFEVELLNVE